MRLQWASKFLVVVSLFWSVCALAQQPKPLLTDPKLTPGDVFEVTVQDIYAGLLEEGASRNRQAQETGLRSIRDHVMGTRRL